LYSRLYSAVVAALLAPVALAQGWIEYTDRDQQFSINLPGEPDVSDIDYTSEYGAVYPARSYVVEHNGGRYSVTVVNFTAAKLAHIEPDDKTDDANARSLWVYDQRSAVAQAARAFRERGGEVTFDAWNNIDRVEGHMLQITNTDGSRTFAGIYLQPPRLYILEATVPSNAPPPGMFQQSISFLDYQGTAVRYELDPDGSRRRVR
jgi:hypothetical protein